MKGVFYQAQAQKRRADKLRAAIARRSVDDEALFKALGLHGESRARDSMQVFWSLVFLALTVLVCGGILVSEIVSKSKRIQELEQTCQKPILE